MAESPESSRNGNGIERRWAGYVIGILLTIAGFLISTAMTFGLFWMNSLSSRVGNVEARSLVLERAMEDMRQDLKEIKADVKRISK